MITPLAKSVRAYRLTGIPVLLDRQTETTALWLFDEPVGCYPSTALADNGPQDITVVPGRLAARPRSALMQIALSA
jgi:hypothetical protein